MWPLCTSRISGLEWIAIAKGYMVVAKKKGDKGHPFGVPFCIFITKYICPLKENWAVGESYNDLSICKTWPKSKKI